MRLPEKLPSRIQEQKRADSLLSFICFRAQELSIPTYKKLSKEARRPVCLSKDLLVKLKCKKKRHRQCNQGHVSWEEHRDAT